VKYRILVTASNKERKTVCPLSYLTLGVLIFYVIATSTEGTNTSYTVNRSVTRDRTMDAL